MKMTKVQKARVIVRALFAMDRYPHEATASENIVRHLKREARQKVSVVDVRYELARKILIADKVIAELS